jgi:hypothetical protein
MPATINGKSPAVAPPRSPSSLPSHLFKPSSSFRTSLSQPHYTRSRAQSIASTQRHRLCPPERRPILCRRRPSSPARLLRIQARLTPLHAVSNFPRPFPFLLVLIVAHASSPERPRRPLPAPAIVGARVSPLSPLSRAHVTPLRNALAWGRFGGREHRPGATPASHRRASPRGSPLRRTRRRYTHAHDPGHPIFGGRPRLDGVYPLELGPPWTREPSSRRGSPRLRASVAVKSEIHGSAELFSFKSP